MKHFIQVDELGYLSAYSFSDIRPGDEWIEVDEQVSLSGGTKKRFIDGLVTDTDVSFLPPTRWSRWDSQTGEWIENTEFAAIAAREDRDALLLKSDWTQLPDVPLATKEAWATYRQQLRDIPDQSGFPLNITWPTPP